MSAEQIPGWNEERDWRDRAACLTEDPELFFPVGTTSDEDIYKIIDAKAICTRCEVRTKCLAWALENGMSHGIWGGMTEDERRALKRESGGKSN
jgi:WhiB family redox-sensing transcriptional regulator